MCQSIRHCTTFSLSRTMRHRSTSILIEEQLLVQRDTCKHRRRRTWCSGTVGAHRNEKIELIELVCGRMVRISERCACRKIQRTFVLTPRLVFDDWSALSWLISSAGLSRSSIGTVVIWEGTIWNWRRWIFFKLIQIREETTLNLRTYHAKF